MKHSQTRICINDTGLIQSNNHVWGNVSHLEPSDNCLNPAAQFRVRDNDAMLKGCYIFILANRQEPLKKQ